jgi:hypothetical protein
MARVTFINAILSGKLAGTIYARNKRGYYVKGWSKPLDPKSAAQLANRSLFSTCAGMWHSLTDGNKQLWNSYGSTIYVAKSGASASPSSGFNALVGLRNSVEIATRQTRVTTVTAPVGTTTSSDDFEFIDTPPVAAMSGAIQTGTGAALPIQLIGATVEGATYETTATFRMTGIAPGLPVFKDAVSDEKVGIILQMSIPQTQMQGFVQGKKIQTLGVWACPTLTNATWTGNLITISMAGADSKMADYKTGVQAGQIVEVTAYLVSKQGEQRSIGTSKVTVS